MDTLQFLLSSPYCWQSSKICHFYHDTNKSQQRNPTFRSANDADARKLGVLGTHGDWRKQVGEDDFDILRKNRCINKSTGALQIDIKWKKLKSRPVYVPPGQHGKYIEDITESATELHGVIRNLWEHSNYLSLVELKDLQWDSATGEFDEDRFVNYWNNKFPKLLSFLWSRFYTHVTSTDLIYYPDWLGVNNLNFDINSFTTRLHNSTIEGLNNGLVEKRYAIDEKGTFEVEFRTLPHALISLMMGAGTSAIWIENLRNKMLLKWYDSKKCLHQLEYSSNLVNSSSKAESICIYFITNLSSDVDKEQIVDKCFSLRQDSVAGRLVVFSSDNSSLEVRNKASKELVEKINTASNAGIKLTDFEVRFEDLSDETRTKLKNDHNYKINLQSSGRHLRGNCRLQILSLLKGSSLNELLHNKDLTLFSHVELPGCNKVYISRRLFRRDLWKSEIFSTASESYVFVVFKPTGSALKLENSSLVACNQVFPVFDISSRKTRTFTLEDELTDFKKLFDKFEGCRDKSICVHFVEYQHENDSFKWQGTKGHFPCQEKEFIEASRKVKLSDEDSFITDIIKGNERLIVIADYPGMGKSQGLIRFANLVMSKKHNRLVCFFTVEKFVKVLLKFKNDIIATLTNFLCMGSNHSEISIIKYLLKETKITIEIFLDGLDEMDEGMQDFAFQAFKMINTNFVSVRIWLTLRDHMLDRIKDEFGLLGYKLEPFSFEKQKQFLREYWGLKLGHNHIKNLHQCHLTKFMTQCINITITDDNTVDIAGIPLQLWMIAEIYEEFVKNGDLEISNLTADLTLTDLYDKIIEKQFQRYIYEKKKVSLQSDSNVHTNISMDDHITNSMRHEMECDHAYYAASLLFSEEKTKEFELSFFTHKRDSEKRRNMILDMGIVKAFTPEIDFIHRTFAEYLLVRFLFRAFESFASDKGWKNVDLKAFDTKFKFLWNNVLELHKPYPGAYDFKHPILCHFLNNLCENSSTEFCKEIRRKCRGFSLNPKTLYRGEYFTIFQMAHSSGFGYVAFLSLHSPDNAARLFHRSIQIVDYDMIRGMINNCGFSSNQWDYIMTCNLYSQLSLFHLFVHGLVCKDATTSEDIKFVLDFLREKLKDKKAIETRDARGSTPLQCLVNGVLPARMNLFRKELHKHFVTELKANVNVVDDHGNTLLHVVTAYDAFYSHCEDYVPFMYLLNGFYTSMLQYLLENGYDKTFLNRFNENGHTPLQSLVHFLTTVESDQYTRYSFCKWYHESTLPPKDILISGLATFKKNEKQTMLINKCFEENVNIKVVVQSAIQIMKTYDVDFNARDRNGDTILHKFIENRYPLWLIKELIINGARVCSRNGDDLCTHQLANQSDIEELTDLLQKYNSCCCNGGLK